MMYIEAFPAEIRLGIALLLVAVTVAICWRWPHAAGRWWLIAAAVVAVWQPLAGAALIPIHGRNPSSAQTLSWPVGDYWLTASLLIIYGQTLCLPAWNTRPARRWFINLLGSWGVFCLLIAAGSGPNTTNELVGLVAKFSAGLMGLGLVFGFWQAMQAGDRKDPWLTTAKNVGLALLVGWLALVVLTAASSGYVWGAPVVIFGILGGSVAVGLGVTLASRQSETHSEPTGVQPAATVAVAAPPTPSSPGEEATSERATAASQAATLPADSLVQSRADTGASPALSAAPDTTKADAPASPEATNQRFSFGAFVAACFVMVLVAWVAVDLAAPHRGPQSPHVTPLGTHEYLQDQGPVNRTLALGIGLTALGIAKLAWRPGWRSFAAGMLVSGLLLALLALGLHR